MRKPAVPTCACLLADHLDAVLAGGEDLLRVRSAPVPQNMDQVDAIVEGRLRQRDAIEKMKALELVVLARTYKARERAAELARINASFRGCARRFAAATAGLVETAAETSDSTVVDFDAADGMVAYLRSRGLIAEGQLTLPESAEIAATERFLLSKRVVLGDIMDIAASFLDALEEAYPLYETDRGEDDAANAAPTTEAATVFTQLPPSAPRRGESLETRIKTRLQSFIEPAAPETPIARGWEPGSLIAALSQAASEAETDSGSSAAA